MKISEANRLRILYFLVFCCTAAWLPIFADYLKGHGLSGIKIGLILAITPVLMFLIQPFYGMLADRLGYKKCLLLSSGLASISYALYLVDASFIWIVFTTIFMSVFYNAIQPILDSLSLRLAQDNPKFSYGTLRIAGAAGWAFTGIITGQLIDAINTTVIFLISAISLFLTFIFTLSLKAKKKETATETSPSFQNIRDIFKNRTLLFLLTCVFLIS